MKITNNDTGSLKVGTSVPNPVVGLKILLAGEKAPRTITYVMGKGEKCHLCAKGSGPFPEGEVEFEVV